MYRIEHERRRRSESRAPAVLAVLVYALLLVVVNVIPGWRSLPVLTAEAGSVVSLLNLVLIVSLVAQTLYLVDDTPRLRAAGSYVISLATVILVVEAWKVFPFDFGTADDSWANATRMILAGLFAWALYSAARASVRLVRGRRAPRLAATRA